VISVLTSVPVDCVVVVSCGLTPMQCTAVDLTLLAELYFAYHGNQYLDFNNSEVHGYHPLVTLAYQPT
jgi:hypothetical protein